MLLISNKRSPATNPAIAAGLPYLKKQKNYLRKMHIKKVFICKHFYRFYTKK